MTKPAFTLRIDAHVPDVIVSPETVAAGDLAEIIRLLEKAFIETARASNAELPETPVFSLVGVSEGSNALACAIDPVLIPAVSTVTRSIADSRFSIIPPAAQRQLHELHKITVRKRWTFGFEGNGDIGLTQAIITPEEAIPEPPIAQGMTTIYGEIIRIGGDRPKVRLRLISGETVTAEVSRITAVQLASRLYTEVGLEGEAVWDTEDFKIVSFRVTRVLPYKETPILEAFQALYDCGGEAWDGINPEDYAREVRGD